MKAPTTAAPAQLALVISETILVVDDHPELCEIASLLLQRCGYRVFTANHPERAKQIARENPNIDLLLSDIEMPVISGDELARWFRRARPRAAVVFMSGNQAHHERLEPYYFISKPFIHLDVLVNTVRTALDNRHAPLQAAA
jgi:CheY-like chemotaxis protein